MATHKHSVNSEWRNKNSERYVRHVTEKILLSTAHTDEHAAETISLVDTQFVKDSVEAITGAVPDVEALKGEILADSRGKGTLQHCVLVPAVVRFTKEGKHHD